MRFARYSPSSTRRPDYVGSRAAIRVVSRDVPDMPACLATVEDRDQVERHSQAPSLMKAVKKCGFPEAIGLLERAPRIAQPPTATAPLTLPQQSNLQPSENAPFKSTYSKCRAESSWLEERSFTSGTLDRYAVFRYANAARRSTFNGSILLRISRCMRRQETETVRRAL